MRLGKTPRPHFFEKGGIFDVNTSYCDCRSLQTLVNLTIFNRVVGERISIVEDIAGVTRDRIYSEGEWLGHQFHIIDTGGIDITDEPFMSNIRMQAEIAMEEADVIIFLTSVKEGCHING